MRGENVWICRGIGLALALALATYASADTRHDIHFLAEHVPESAMDAHYMALPWPAGDLNPDRWQTSLDLSAASTRTDFIDIDGPMIAFAAAKGRTRHSGYELLGFYSAMDVSGGDGRTQLGPWFLHDVPLDLPQIADFTDARGTFRHYGLGAAYVRGRASGRPEHAPQIIAGVLLERAEAAAFAIDYRLVAGTNAGTAGTLDHSSRATFVTPFVGWQQTRSIAPRWTWSPRAFLAWPMPPGDFDGRLTGPGFERASPADGAALKLGDPFANLGLALRHVPSGLEVDLGGTLFFAAAEHVSHAGVDRSLVMHVAWRRPAPRAVAH